MILKPEPYKRLKTHGKIVCPKCVDGHGNNWFKLLFRDYKGMRTLVLQCVKCGWLFKTVASRKIVKKVKK